MKKVYLDYAASTPVDPRVGWAMEPYFSDVFGNPQALHSFGQEASRAVFSARRRIAESIGADYKEIIFTGSATEANNLAIRGIAKSIKYQVSSIKYPRIITTAIEHESVLETCRDLECDGVEVIYIPVSREGIVDLKKLKSALNENTVLVSVMYANNEVGTIQPIQEIAGIVRDDRSDRNEQAQSSQTWRSRSNKRSDRSSIIEPKYPLLHTDAVQAFQYLNCNVNDLGIDLMTLSAHKIYGPKGIGCLFVRSVAGIVRDDRSDRNEQAQSSQTWRSRSNKRSDRSSIIEPIITGSGQEFGLRSGTDNVPYIAGFAKAVEITDKIRKQESKRVIQLRDYFWQKLAHEKRAYGKWTSATRMRPHELELNGSIKERLPNNLNIYFPGQSAHDLQIKLDLAGVAVSPGAACTTRVSKESFVLREMGFSKERASGSLRFTLGRQTSKKDIDYTISTLVKLF